MAKIDINSIGANWSKCGLTKDGGLPRLFMSIGVSTRTQVFPAITILESLALLQLLISVTLSSLKNGTKLAYTTLMIYVTMSISFACSIPLIVFLSLDGFNISTT